MMRSITAVLHTQNDALRLGRALETLYPCDEILVVDHGSDDGTAQIAREYGARVRTQKKDASPGDYLQLAEAEWILCLDPTESLTESLAASLFEWKTEPLTTGVGAFSMFLREETIDGWVANPVPQTRLVPYHWNQWDGRLPLHNPSAVALEGELLHFAFP
jgi:(heptosyl)LPS beta-1,4-glucosyltransferase